MSQQAEFVGPTGLAQRMRFVRNERPGITRFTSEMGFGKYRWERSGYAGSIIPVPEQLLYDPFIVRGIQRGVFFVYDKSEEAVSDMQGLRILMDEQKTDQDRLIEAMGVQQEGDDHRYVRPVPEFGRETAEWGLDQIFGDQRKNQVAAQTAPPPPTPDSDPSQQQFTG